MNFLFGIYLMLGIVIPQDDVDGRVIYSIHTKKVNIDYAYKGEVKQWLRSKEFKYNEDIQD